MHPLQGRLSVEMKRVWLAALEDASIPVDRALLVVRPGSAAPDGRCAVYMRRGRSVSVEGLDGALQDELNSTTTGSVYAYRVVLWAGRRIEEAAALIRHELEHARQIDARPEVEGLHGLAEEVLGGQPESGRLYQEMPAEADANAASGVWARSYFGDDRIAQLIAEGSPDAAALRPSAPPPDVSDLPERMIEFFVSIADLCRRWEAKPDVPLFSRCLDLHWRGAGRRWERMVRRGPRPAEGPGPGEPPPRCRQPGRA
jgi:hypothetical protein